MVYSNIRKFKDDLPLFRPDFFVCVPLVLDTLHAKVMHTFRTMAPARKAIVQVGSRVGRGVGRRKGNGAKKGAHGGKERASCLFPPTHTSTFRLMSARSYDMSERT